MYALALKILVVATAVLRTPGVKWVRSAHRTDASLGDVLRTFQLSRNDVTYWSRARDETCGLRSKELFVHLSTVPNSGTTWTMFLFEEATGIITQRHGNETLGDRSACRLQFPLSNSAARLAINDELELFKTHYPGLPGESSDLVNGLGWHQTLYAPSDPQYAASRCLVIVRNPIDAFFALLRHQDKGAKVILNLLESKNGSECLSVETETRSEMIGQWLDPEGFNVRSNISDGNTTTEDEFQSYFQLWVRFVAYWFQYSSSECTDVTMVRYEDLADFDRNLDTLSVLVNAFNSSVTSNAIERAALTYAPATSTTYDVYTNATLDKTAEVQGFASVAIEESELMSALGYITLLERIIS